MEMPGERVPPTFTVKEPLMEPLPPRVAPEFTTVEGLLMEPLIRNVPAETVVLPV